jgi:hypothetical protein
MNDLSSMPKLPLIIIGALILLGCALLAGAAFMIMNPIPADSGPPPLSTSIIPTRATATPTATVKPTESPTPTATATEAEPTDGTEEPTEEAQTAAATAVPPTRAAATNPPRPTNTPVPPTAPPASNRILNPGFSVEATTVPANQGIWFNFSVTNASTTAALSYGALGAAIYKDGARVHFQGSYTNAALDPGQQLNWRDHTAIGAPGIYQLQLAICYTPSLDACTWPNGDWELLAQPITVTIQ